jgi:hypothetical protein
MGQSAQGISLVAFLTALASSLVILGVQMFAFILLKDKLARILYVLRIQMTLDSSIIVLI